MDEQPLQTTAPAPISGNPILVIVASFLVSGLVVGGSVFAYQSNQAARQQAQIDSLRQQLALAATATPSPVSTATAKPTASPSPTPTTIPIAAFTKNQLMNFSYLDMSNRIRKLSNGVATFPATGSTGSLTLNQNFLPAGDLNGDSVPDSAVVLYENLGGTGSFPLIEAVINNDGQPLIAGWQNILEDRSVVTSLTIDKGLITVTGTIRSSDQPLSDRGNLSKTEVFKVVGGKLVGQ